MKSLVVDDDITCSYIFQTQLSRYGHCDTVTNGWDAIEAYKSSLNKNDPYHLIIIDIMMPDMNGYEVLKNIRAIEAERQIRFPFNAKIILATGLDDIENRQLEEKLDELSEAYLVKSNDLNALINKLNLLGFDLSEFV